MYLYSNTYVHIALIKDKDALAKYKLYIRERMMSAHT